MNITSWNAELIIMQPYWFMVLPVIGGFYLLYLWKPQRFSSHKQTALPILQFQQTQVVRHPLIGLLESNITRSQTKSSLGLTLLTLTLFIISLSEPVLKGQQLPEVIQERDIIFIVDTSISMILRDYLLDGQRVDRMTLLKSVLDRMIQQLKNDRISIIVYGTKAYTLVPLTRDQSLLRNMLERIKVTMAGRLSTTGEAIALGLQQVLTRQKSHQSILVLLTTASHSTGMINVQAAAQLAAEKHIPLYTIAVGAASHAAEESRQAGLIYHPANLQQLQKLASITEALAFRAGDSEALQKVLNNINQRETHQQQQPIRYQFHSLYYCPLLAGLLLLFIQSIKGILQDNTGV